MENYIDVHAHENKLPEQKTNTDLYACVSVLENEISDINSEVKELKDIITIVIGLHTQMAEKDKTTKKLTVRID